MHQGVGSDSQVVEHDVALPPTNKFGGGCVDPGAEKRHGAAGAEGTRLDQGRVETQVGERDSGVAEEGRGVTGSDVAPTAAVAVGVEGCRRGGVETAEVTNPAEGGEDGAGVGVPRASVGHTLTPGHVLLGGEYEKDVGSCAEQGEGRADSVEGGLAVVKYHVPETERVRFVGGGAVLPAAHEKVPCEYHHVAGGVGGSIVEGGTPMGGVA